MSEIPAMRVSDDALQTWAQNPMVIEVDELEGSRFGFEQQPLYAKYISIYIFISDIIIKYMQKYTISHSLLVSQNQQLWDLGLATADMANEEKVDAKIAELSAQVSVTKKFFE